MNEESQKEFTMFVVVPCLMIGVPAWMAFHPWWEKSTGWIHAFGLACWSFWG